MLIIQEGYLLKSMGQDMQKYVVWFQKKETSNLPKSNKFFIEMTIKIHDFLD